MKLESDFDVLGLSKGSIGAPIGYQSCRCPSQQEGRGRACIGMNCHEVGIELGTGCPD